MIKRLLNRMIKIQTKRAEYWMLQNMTDRELKDIGLTRADINQTIYIE